jgi:putative SOS response-associated peptidase YedK
MCGRYGFIPIENIQERFKTSNQLELTARYNVSPGATMPVVTRNSPHQVELMRWGIKPFWIKGKTTKVLFNARAETITEKPMFARLVRKYRCLIPASLFYEWQQWNGSKQPYAIRLKRRSVFAFAGLYERDLDASSYLIITTHANTAVQPVHARMPVILSDRAEDIWLDEATSVEQLKALLQPYASDEMKLYPVSDLVNSASEVNDRPQIMEPLTRDFDYGSLGKHRQNKKLPWHHPKA